MEIATCMWNTSYLNALVQCCRKMGQLESTANFTEAAFCVSWDLEAASMSMGVWSKLWTYLHLILVRCEQVCLVRGGLLAHLQREMAHVFVGFTELFDSMCINPLLQLCS